MKKILKTLFFSLHLLWIPNLVADVKNSHEVVLTSEMVHFLDGKAFGVNPSVIKRMLQVRREIKKNQFGEISKSGSHEGHYLFEGERHTVRSLASLESSVEMEFYQKEAEYLKDRIRYAQELIALEQWYNLFKKNLRKVLEQARTDIGSIIAPFAANVREAKDQMVVLITESCQKHNRSDCFLLKWADAPKDQEMAYFHTHITSFKALDQFCSDLINFFDDLMRSCPKAWAQFKKMMEDQHQAHGHKGTK